MRPFLANASYVNYIGDEGLDGLRGSYGEEKFTRLAAIKSKYDPTNLFRMNQNITPVPAAA
jgi:FAD/FMN-containing dehydrogenase